MNRLSKQSRSMVLNAVLILGTLIIVVFLTVRSGEIVPAWKALRSADIRWVGGAAGCFIVYAAFEGLLLHVFFLQQKIKVKLSASILAGLTGMFYSAITPSATGGQPMQVFSLKKRNVPVGVSTSALAVKFFNWQCALLILGAVMWLTHPGVVRVNVDQLIWIVLTGYFVNSLTVIGVLLLAVNRNIVSAMIVFILRAGHKLRLVKDLEGASSRADAALQDFHASVDMLRHHPVQMLVLLLMSFVQVAAMMSVIFCVYRSFGLHGSTFGELFTLQLLLYIAASMTPLPGGSGAQEGGFYLFFQQAFPGGTLVGALLLWRFLTYYLSIILGFAGVLLDSASRIRRRRDEEELPPFSQNQD